MNPSGKLVDAHITTDRERYFSCPAIQAARHNHQRFREIPFEQIAGTPIRIHLRPLPPKVGVYAELCEMTHWPVYIEDARLRGHKSEPWVCPHMIDLPD